MDTHCGRRVSFFGHAPVVRMYLSDGDEPADCVSLTVEGLMTLSQLAADWARWLAAQTGEPVPAVPQPDDRERRIRELVTKWVETTQVYQLADIDSAFEAAGKFIDAIDAAEIPKKGGE